MAGGGWSSLWWGCGESRNELCGCWQVCLVGSDLRACSASAGWSRLVMVGLSCGAWVPALVCPAGWLCGARTSGVGRVGKADTARCGSRLGQLGSRMPATRLGRLAAGGGPGPLARPTGTGVLAPVRLPLPRRHPARLR